MPHLGAHRRSVVAWALTLGATGLLVLGSASASPSQPAVVTPYTVTFTESGLPIGTNWSVHVAFTGCSCDGVYRTVRSNTSAVTIKVTDGTYNYRVLVVAGFYVSVGNTGSFLVNGTNVSGIAFTFHRLFTYVATVQETGLPASTVWSASVSGNGTGQLKTIEHQTTSSDTGSLSFALPNGTYRYSVPNVNGSFFLNHTQRGTFVVAGTSPSPVDVAWISPAVSPVTFTESGLGTGTNWSVRVAGWGGATIREVHSSTSPTTTFYLPNGTYHYAVAQVMGFVLASPASGGLLVPNGSLAIAVGFRPVAPGAFYPVGFQETGLANGTHWSVTVTELHTFGHSRKATQSSTGAEIFLLVQNNSYRFVVHPPRGYTLPTGGSGNFSIYGSAPSVFLVSFVPVPTFTITVTESGLPNGTNWSVLLRSERAGSTPWPIRTVDSSNATAITFSVPNGAYCYRIYAVYGYKIVSGPATGALTVSGAPTGVTVEFA